MCRLTAYVGEPASPAPLLFGGAHSLLRQSWAPRELLTGSVNADGWGVVWYDDDRPVRLAEARPVWQEEGLREVLAPVRTRCAVAALRNATPGIPADRSGLLPLVRDGWAFVLNGYVPGFRRRHMRALRAELPDDLYAHLLGSSDSETLFLRVLALLQQGAPAADALGEVTRAVYDRVGDEECQLTMVLADARSVTAVRSSNAEATNSLYLAAAHPLAPHGTLLASEPLDDHEAWRPVPGHHLVAIDGAGTRVAPAG